MANINVMKSVSGIINIEYVVNFILLSLYEYELWNQVSFIACRLSIPDFLNAKTTTSIIF